jgi:hypothetical protein
LDHFTLPRILRFGILKETATREGTRELVKLIEREERTMIKNKEEIFK